MNENIKNEIVTFAMDLQALCNAQHACKHCPLNSSRGGYCKGGFMLHEQFDPETTIAAVEAYRKRKKLCAEVVDEALDVYTIEVKVKRNEYAVQVLTPEQGAKYAASYLMDAYPGDYADTRILSANRYVLQSHREEEE